jgi:hypothetical protein
MKTNFLGQYQALLEEIVESGKFTDPIWKVEEGEKVIGTITDPQLKVLWTFAEQKKKEKIEFNEQFKEFLSSSDAFEEIFENCYGAHSNHFDVAKVRTLEEQCIRTEKEENIFRELFWFLLKTEDIYNLPETIGIREDWQIVEVPSSSVSDKLGGLLELLLS